MKTGMHDGTAVKHRTAVRRHQGHGTYIDSITHERGRQQLKSVGSSPSLSCAPRGRVSPA